MGSSVAKTRHSHTCVHLVYSVGVVQFVDKVPVPKGNEFVIIKPKALLSRPSLTPTTEPEEDDDLEEESQSVCSSHHDEVEDDDQSDRSEVSSEDENE